MKREMEERFHELAHKLLAHRASAAEREELAAMIAQHPEWRREFDQMGPEAAAATRELLPLAEALQQHDAPRMPTARLRREIKKAFQPEGEELETLDLLYRLAAWKEKQDPAIARSVERLISRLRETLGTSVPRLAEAVPDFLLETTFGIQEPRIAGKMRRSPEPRSNVETLLRLERRLSAMEEDIRQCREELRAFLNSVEH